MFPTNPSPLAPFPRQLEPVSHPRGSRYPGCFSGSEDNLARTTVTTEVQMNTNSLQSEEASLSRSRAYGHLLQEWSEVTGHKKTSGGLRTQQGHRADSGGMEVEEGSEYGPLVSDSDSDDSAHREIEEAIQEYLEDKGLGGQPPVSSTEKGGEMHAQEERSTHNPICSVFHAGVETPGIEWQQHASADPKRDSTKWPPSPSSMSSNNYFEQSTQAEIEPFSSEKEQARRRRRRSRVVVVVKGRNEPLVEKEAQCKLGLGSQEEEMYQENQRRENQALQGTLLECWNPESSEQLADFRTTCQAQFGTPLAVPSLGQSKGDEKRQAPWKARVGNKQLADSSSDKGIKEASQLYHLEKTRKAAVTERGPLPCRSEEGQAGGAEEISRSPAVPLMESAWPAIGREPRRRKRRAVLGMPTELSQQARRCQELQKDKSCTPPENSAATFPAGSQVDTSAEPMCAEAILDISKAILPPPPMESENRPFGRELASGPQASHQERDTFAVDSDGNTKQERQAFLALKAQAERFAMEPREASCNAQDPASSSQLQQQAQSPKRMSPNPSKLPLSRKGESRPSTLIPHGLPMQAETDWSCVDGARSETSASQPENESTAPGASWHQEGPKATISSLLVANSFSWGQLAPRNHAEKTMHNPPKYGPGDENSSLDSDEDLDTAIHDLLQSKQKQMEKPQDQRIHWKKQVRFGATEMMPALKDQGEACRSKDPALLKSCLAGSGRDLNVGSATKQTGSTAEWKLKDARAIQASYELHDPAKPFSLPNVSKCPRSPWAAGSFPSDSSSDKSDDSIELEIQRFLAEKAKDSTSSVETLGARTIPVIQEADKLWTPQLKAKCQAWKGQGGAPSQQRGSMEKGGPPLTGLRGSPRSETKTRENASGANHTVASAEEMWSNATVPLQRHQGLLFAPGVGVPAPSTAAESRGLGPGKLVQRDLPGEGIAEHPTEQSCLAPLCPLRRKPAYNFSVSRQCFRCLESMQPEKKAVLWGKRPGAESPLLKSQGGVAASSLGSERRGALVEEAEFSPSFLTEGLPSCTSEERAKRKGASSCCARVNLAQGCPWAVEGGGFHTGLLNLEIPREEGKGQEHVASGGEGSVTHAPCTLPLREKLGYDQGRAAEHQPPKALAGASVEVTDRVTEESAHCPVESNASSF